MSDSPPDHIGGSNHDWSTCPFVVGSETLDFTALVAKVDHAMQLVALLADASVATAAAVSTKAPAAELRRFRLQIALNAAALVLVLAMTGLIAAAVLPFGPIYRDSQRQTGRAVASIIVCVNNHADVARDPNIPRAPGCP